MANVFVIAPSGNTNLRAVFTSGAQYLRADNGQLESFDDVTSYRVSPTDSVLLSAELSRYRFVIPNPVSLPITLNFVVSDIATHEILGAGYVRLDADGNEIDEAATLAATKAAVDSIEVTADVSILPLVSTVSSGEVRARNLTAYQHARLSFTFSIVDQTGAAVDLTGHSVVLVVSAKCERLWQVDCTVTGNVVTVMDDDTNTGTAGEFDYVLRDMTDDTVIARGMLAVVPAVDAA
jgi:hypothetical protein